MDTDDLRWIEPLTRSEMETMILLSRGFAPRYVATMRGVRLRTVFQTMQSVRQKTGSKTRDEAMAVFIMHSLAVEIAQTTIASTGVDK